MRNLENHLLRLGCALLAGAALLFVLSIKNTPVVSAHVQPAPCDFTTGGGFVITDQGNHANFGLVAGCKNGGYFGHFNFVDHDTSGLFAGLHVSSTQITGYFDPCINGCGNPPRYRDICGTADTNLFGSVYFRARTYDGGEPGIGGRAPHPAGADRWATRARRARTGDRRDRCPRAHVSDRGGRRSGGTQVNRMTA